MDAASGPARWLADDQRVSETLVIAFTMVVRDELRHRTSEVALAKRDHAVKVLLLDRPHNAFRVGVRIRRALGRHHDSDAHVPQLTPHVATPLPIAITDQDLHV
jgi:hypothetical protein